MATTTTGPGDVQVSDGTDRRSPRDGREQPVPDEVTRIVLRPIANPLPLGILALATATLLLSGLELGWFPSREGTEVALAIVAVAAPLLLLAAVFGFLARDTLAATGLGLSGATWLLLGLSKLIYAPVRTDHALGVFLLMAAVAVSVTALPAVTMKVVPAAVLLLTATRFLLTGLYELTGSGTVRHGSAIVGLILVVVAVYAALALELESAKRHTVLPVLRRGAAHEAVTGDLADQITRVEGEAGVREQL